MGLSVLGAKNKTFFARYFEKHILFIISGLKMNIARRTTHKKRERKRRGRRRRRGRSPKGRDRSREKIPIKGWPRSSLVLRCPFDGRRDSTSSF